MRTVRRDRVGRSIVNLLLLVFAVLLFAFASAVAQILVEPDALRPETRLAGGRGLRRHAPRNLSTLEER